MMNNYYEWKLPSRRAGLCLALLAVGLFALAILPAQAKSPQSFSADFSGVLNFAEQGDLDLEVAGRVYHSAPYTRIEFKHPLTMEDMVLLLDAEQSNAVLLYPDTLNGISYGYAGKYYAEWPGGFPDYLSATPSAFPAGWKKTVGKAAADGTRQVKLVQGEVSVTCTIDGKSQPQSMKVVTPGHTASFKFSNYDAEETLRQSMFAVPKDFAIERVTSLEGEQALPL